MAEQKQGKHGKKPNQKRFQRRPQPAPLTPEQQAALKAAQEKAAADAKAEQERYQNWEKRVEKMSHKQFRGEIRAIIRKERVKVGRGHYDPTPGLTLAFATVFDNILETTRTKDNPFGKLSHYLNPVPF